MNRGDRVELTDTTGSCKIPIRRRPREGGVHRQPRHHRHPLGQRAASRDHHPGRGSDPRRAGFVSSCLTNLLPIRRRPWLRIGPVSPGRCCPGIWRAPAAQPGTARSGTSVPSRGYARASCAAGSEPGRRSALLAATGPRQWPAPAVRGHGAAGFAAPAREVRALPMAACGRDRRAGGYRCPREQRTVMTDAGPWQGDAGLAARFPGWEIERRADGLPHAWLVGTNPPLVVSGADEATLRDQIRAAALDDLQVAGTRRNPPRADPPRTRDAIPRSPGALRHRPRRSDLHRAKRRDRGGVVLP